MKSGYFERGIATSINFNQMMLSSVLSSAQWRNSVDRDTATAFKRICEFQVHISGTDNELELRCDRGSGIGLLYAYSEDNISISLASHSYWKSLDIKSLLIDASDDIAENVHVANISEASDVCANNKRFSLMSLDKSLECKTPEQLLKAKDRLFPHLIFHQNAVRQLESQVQSQHVSALVKKLYEINEYFSNWSSGGFDPNKFKTKISPESTATLKMYKKEHTFLYNGYEILVSYHLRYTGSIAGRVYFHPDEDSRKGLICSLNTKLPTVSEK